MSPDRILDHLRRQPFRPIRIYLSEGSSYEVAHPELALVTRREVVIALPEAEGALPDRSVFCDPLHITRIEPIDGAKPKGKSRKRNT